VKENMTLRQAIEWAREHNKRPPDINTLIRWDNDGVSKTPDGCKVDSDGYCKHGYPSWTLIEGLI
jgi:hypothetical protein